MVIDLGAEYELEGFSYWPIQERYPFGIITKYEFSVSTDNRSWRLVAEGEFSNVVNNRIEQSVQFASVKARYIKLKGMEVAGEDYQASIGELGVRTQ